ncbi:MAG: hypothetical protein AB7F78_02030, partial [Hyphomicrobiaceae bacterium]
MPDTQIIVGEGGRQLVAQSLAGAMAPVAGSGGLSPGELARWCDSLTGPLEGLRRAYDERTLPHLRIPEQTADIADAEAAMAALMEGARTVVFLGTGGSSLGGQALSQLNGWNLPGGADEAQRQRPRTRF